MKKLTSASALALVSAGAVAECAGGTTTVREIPVAAGSTPTGTPAPGTRSP